MPSATEVDSMVVRLLGDASGYARMLTGAVAATASAVAGIERHGTAVQSFSQKIRGYASSATAALAPLVGIGFGLSTMFKAVQEAASSETLRVEFGVLLKDDAAGQLLVDRLQKFAADTPLGMTEIQQSTKTLLQFQIGADKVVDTMRMLGDVALGDAEKLKSLARQYGQMVSSGRVQMDELNIMTETGGFNPLSELSRTTGRSMGELRKAVSDGRITVEQIIGAFKSATSEGGNWFQGMEKKSKTLGGLFSTMQDDVAAALRSTGESIVQAFDLKSIVKQVSDLAQSATRFLDQIPAGFFKVAAAVMVSVVAVGALIGAFFMLKWVVGLATGGLSLVFGLVAALATTGVFGMTGLIVSAGGVGGAFASVVRYAREFWEWLLPVRRQVQVIGEMLYDLVGGALRTARGYVLELWDSLVSGAGTSWEQVRAYALTALVAVEYALRNQGEVANLAWSAVKYHAAVAINYVEYGFTTLLPAALRWFYDNAASLGSAYGQTWAAQAVYYKDVLVAVFESINWSSVWEAFRTASMAQIGMVVAALRAIPAMVSMGVAAQQSMLSGIFGAGDQPGKGGDTLGEKLKNLTRAHQEKLKGIWGGIQPFTPPERVPPETELALKAEYERLAGKTAEAFDAFRRRRLAELSEGEYGDGGGDYGGLPGEDQNKGQGQPAGKTQTASMMDAVKLASAEAMRRREEHMMKLRDSKAGPGGRDAVASNTAEAVRRQQETNDILKERLPKAGSVPPGGQLSVKPADLGGFGDGGGGEF